MRKRERERIVRRVERQLRPGGRPIATYFDLKASELPEGLYLTNATFRNLEDRIVAIEKKLGLA